LRRFNERLIVRSTRVPQYACRVARHGVDAAPRDRGTRRLDARARPARRRARAHRNNAARAVRARPARAARYR